MKKIIFSALTIVTILCAFAFTAKNNSSSVTMIVSHQVKDFATWKKGFEKGSDARAKAGITITGIFQSVDDANMVTIISEAPSAEAAKGFGANPELKAAMEKVGVISQPEIKILNKAK